MKRPIFKALCALVLSLAVLCALSAPMLTAALTPAESAHLHFGADGKFRILNFSDFQETTDLSARSRVFIRKAVYAAQPDLVVLTGDNIYGTKITSNSKTAPSIACFMDIFEQLGIPVAIVFGNHDDEGSALSREEQMAIYNSYSVSVSYDEGDAISGCGNYNIPIYADADSDDVRFNLWMFDTHKSVLNQDQLDWYASQAAALKARNGGVPVPAIAFQHIIVREIFYALKSASSSTPGAVSNKVTGGYCVLPDNAAPGSVMREAPCPGSSFGEFAAVKAQGDVIAIVCGHDHINQFVVPYQGIDIINTPSAGFGAYGDEDMRGARVIDVDVSGSYSTFMLNMLDSEQPEYYVRQGVQKYVKNIALCVERTSVCGGVEQAIQQAYTRVYDAVDAANGNGIALRWDLNGGSTSDSTSGDHYVVCMGYTLTSDVSQAMRRLTLLYDGTSTQYDGQTVNGCKWELCNTGSRAVSADGAVNLNVGTGGKQIYFYASYNASDSPITEIRVVNTGSDSISMSDYSGYSLVYPTIGSTTGASYADLNKSARGDYVYALTKTAADNETRLLVDSSALRAVCFEAGKLLKRPETIYTQQSRTALSQAVQQARTVILKDLDDDKRTLVYDQSALDQQAQTIRTRMQQLSAEGIYTGGNVPRRFTVTFDANGGTCGTASRTFAYGERCGTLPSAQRSRFLPAGWFTKPTGGEAVTESSTFRAASDQTWYMHWVKDNDWVAGDANQDGEINLQDTVSVVRYLVGGWGEMLSFDHADVDWNGTVDLRDVVLMQRYLASGWNVELY